MNQLKTQKPVRVLHVLGTTNLGGAESRIMELYRSIDRDKVQFDFLVHTKEEGHYDEEIRNLGGEIYHLPRFQVINLLQYRRAIKVFFESHKEYVVIQGHMTSTAAIYLPIAKKVNPSVVTVAHARSAGVDKGLKGYVTRLLRMPLKRKADYCFACSKEAAVSVFGSKCVKEGSVSIIPNAISVERFRFNKGIRDSLREEMNLSNRFVIGHVGRFGFMKNHAYLIDVFAKLCEYRENMMLVLIGKGEEEPAIREKVNALGLTDKVLFLGNKFDVEKYYQIFDYFVFPSTFEGLPGSVVEAQAAGLHCMISDRITQEVALTSLVSYRCIDEDAEMWAEEILENENKAYIREDMRDEIERAGFDVKTQAKLMEQFYLTGINPPGNFTKNP